MKSKLGIFHINGYQIENLGDTYFIQRIVNPQFRIAVDIKNEEPMIIRLDMIDKPIKVSEIADRLSEIKELLDIITERHR